MSRERLTNRVAAEDMKAKPGTQVEAKGAGVDSDSYDMNDTGHEKNDPKVDTYAKGDPSAWGEDVAAQNWAGQDKGGEKRGPTGHAELIDKHAATEAVATVKALEKKAVKCMVASQRMLPGAADDMIVKQAIDLMNLPEEAVNATLARQETLANSMKQAAAEEKEPEEKKDEKEAASKKILVEKQAQLEAMKKQAADLEKEILAGQNDPKYFYGEGQKIKDVEAAAKKEEEEACDKEATKKEEKKEEEVEAAAKKEEKKEEGEEVEAAKKEEKKEEGEEVDAASKKDEEEEETSKEASLLDTIFSDVIASNNKKGATKLSGMVKKEASTDGDSLSKLWASAPDMSGLFQ